MAETKREAVARAIWTELEGLAPHMGEPMRPGQWIASWAEATDDMRFIALCLAAAAIAACEAWEVEHSHPLARNARRLAKMLDREDDVDEAVR